MVRSTLLVPKIIVTGAAAAATAGDGDGDAVTAAASFREVDLVIRMSLANDECCCLSSSVLEIPSPTDAAVAADVVVVAIEGWLFLRLVPFGGRGGSDRPR